MADLVTMTGHCYRCVSGARPETWCEGCPNRPRPVGKTWREEAVERWLDMEAGEEADRLLRDIMRDQRDEMLKREPRRLFKGTVALRHLDRHERRKARMRRVEVWRYYREDPVALAWPFSSTHGVRAIDESLCLECQGDACTAGPKCEAMTNGVVLPSKASDGEQR